jgi:phosphoglycerol transferase MdoB-like AlkP superfamily enzyme
MDSPVQSLSPKANPALRGAVVLGILHLVIALLTRIALLMQARHDVNWDLSLAGAFLSGGMADVVTTFFVVLLWLLLCSLLPQFLWRRVGWWFTAVLFFVYTAALLFAGVAEWFFWEEFQVRFNFIAVDYLVWTQEVWGNISESYPMPLIISLLAVASLAVVGLLIRLGCVRWVAGGQFTVKSRFAGLFTMPAISGLCVVLLSESLIPPFQNEYHRELGKNGFYSLFAAFRRMEIDYDKFYRVLPVEEALSKTRVMLTTEDAKPVSDQPLDLRRRITAAGPEQRWNVVIVCMESMSADFMGMFGNSLKLTPNLDRLAADGLLFSQCYATGTRTVRGLEALTLSLPPTPGQAIIYRPGSTGLYTLGALFGARGYESAFLYGGDGRFDYMNRYFGGNGYKALDKNAWDGADITFETSWGACDEDLFRKAIQQGDAAHAAGRPFHLFCMTTSNHRPFLFPTGKFVRRPELDGRQASVAYADYAVGQLVEAAAGRPWFDNTVFLFVADHCASSAGKSDLDVTKFHIPAILWSPKLIAPRDVSTLCSQIDLVPTLLGLMRWQYTSLFFGRDVLSAAAGGSGPRAFVSNYQKIGLLHPDRLAILKPRREVALYRADLATGGLIADESLTPLADEAAAWYQSASWLWRNQLHTGQNGVTLEMAQ